jgi:apolipoprotein N-acyltransferase
MLKYYAWAILSGVLLALAWPTYGFSPLIFVAFVPLLFAEYKLRKEQSKNNLHSFFTAYLAFIVWNIITTWWIWYATKAGAVFAIVVNSLLMTLVFYFYHLIAKRKTQRFSLIFLTAAWIAFEKFHHNWDFSWPWLSLGNVFSENIQWIQWYEYTGIFGGTLWIWLVNAILFTGIVSYEQYNNKKLLGKRVIVAAAWVVIGMSISQLIYYNYNEEENPITAVMLQPATDPYSEKYNRSHNEIVDELINLSGPYMQEEVDIILAPETVLSTKTTRRDFEQSIAYTKLQNFVIQHPKTSLLFGFDQYEIFSKNVPKSSTANTFTNSTEAWYESYNAALFVSAVNPAEYYHKSKLVVGVEHFPFRNILKPLLGNVMIDLGGSVSTLTPNEAPQNFKLAQSQGIAAPSICYESIYGEFTSGFTQKGANFLAIITNDSWWRETQGHKQLLSYARLRAIEQRRSVARSANSGISAIINQKGEIEKRLEYNVKGALQGNLNLNDKLTFYAKNGDYIARISAFVAVLFLLVGFFVKTKK